jgi:hypothetical protein
MAPSPFRVQRRADSKMLHCGCPRVRREGNDRTLEGGNFIAYAICVAMRDETSRAATFTSREVNPESGCVGVQPRGLTPSEMLRMPKFRRRQYRAMIQSAHAAEDAFRQVPRSAQITTSIWFQS